MIAPEQWYDYQKQYQKYGIDMKPQSEVDERRRQRRNGRKEAPKGLVLTVGNDRKAILWLVLIGAVSLILVVLMSSYAAKLTYDINSTKAENDVIIGEIEDLDVQILSTNNISYVESQAKDKLGMKSAGKSCVYVSADDVPEEGFAEVLRDKAYN